MDLFTIIAVIIGLIVFETVNSIDNVIINSEVLSTMKPESRRWFMSWGILFAIFFVRGFFPWILLWFALPGVGFLGILGAGLDFGGNTLEAIGFSAAGLVALGSAFLISVFLRWFFVESERKLGILEKGNAKKISRYALLGIFVLTISYFSFATNPGIALGALAGALLFIAVVRIRKITEEAEKNIEKEARGDWGKILYLEILDTTFSIDGVLGAFAFTLSIPLIFIGNGIGAIIVRKLTSGNIERVKRYRHLKDGAMYSIFVLAIIMALESLGTQVPSFVPTLTTIAIVGYYFLKSSRENNKKN